MTSSSGTSVLKRTNLAICCRPAAPRCVPPPLAPCQPVSSPYVCKAQTTSLRCFHHCDSLSGAVACAWVDNGPAPSLLLSGLTESNTGSVILFTFAAGLGCFGDWCHKLSWGPLNVRPALVTQQSDRHQYPQPHRQMLPIGNDKNCRGRHSPWLPQGRLSPTYLQQLSTVLTGRYAAGAEPPPCGDVHAGPARRLPSPLRRERLPSETQPAVQRRRPGSDAPQREQQRDRGPDGQFQAAQAPQQGGSGHPCGLGWLPPAGFCCCEEPRH